MKNFDLNTPIANLVPENANGPIADNRPLIFDGGDYKEGAYQHFKSRRVTVALNGMAHRRLEVLAHRLGYSKIQPVCKILLEAAAGCEAADFYSLVALITQGVHKSQERAAKRL